MGVTGVGERSDTGDRPEGSGANGVESSISACMLYAAGASNDGFVLDKRASRCAGSLGWWGFDALCGQWLLERKKDNRS
jgi:hypothetical protein